MRDLPPRQGGTKIGVEPGPGTWAEARPVARSHSTGDSGVVALYDRPASEAKVAGGFEGKLQSSEAQFKEQQKAVNDLLANAQATAQYMESAADAAHQAAQAWSMLAGGAEGGGGGDSGVSRMSAPRTGGTSMREGGAGKGGSTQWLRSFDQARNTSISDLRSGAGQLVARAANRLPSPPTLTEIQRRDAQGHYMSGTMMADLSQGERPLSGMQRVMYPPMGWARNAIGAAASGVDSGVGILGGMARAGGSVGMVGMAGLGVTAGAAAAIQGYGMLRSQFQANNEFRQITGGDQGDAFQERAQMAGFKLGNFFNPFGLTGADAEKLYMGTLSAGYRDDRERSNVMGFGVQNYEKYGMSVDDTLALVRTAAKTGQSELTGLAQSLEAVAEGAKRAKVGVGDQQRAFTEQFAGVSAVMGSAMAGTAGTTPAVLAGALTNWQATLGPEFKDVNFQAQLNNPDLLYMMAARSGFPGDPDAMMATWSGPQGGVKAARDFARLPVEAATRALGPDVRGYFEQWIRARNNGRLVNPSQADVDLFVRQNGEMLPPTLRVHGILAEFGFQVPQGEAREAALKMLFAGEGLVSEANQIASRETSSLRGGGRGANQLRGMVNRAGGAEIMTRKEFKADQAGGAMNSESGESYRHYVEGEVAQLAGRSGEHQGDAAIAYAGAFARTGKKFGIVDDLISAIGDQEDDQDAFRVRVRAKGKSYEVGLEEALNNFYGQIVDGSAMITAGKLAGQTVAEATGYNRSDMSKGQLKFAKSHAFRPGAGNQGIKDLRESSEDISKWGPDEREQFKKARRKAGGQGGTVRIVMEPELRRFLKAVPMSPGITTGDNTQPVGAG